MTVEEMLKITKHRPWKLPPEKWKYYQEWSNALFLHWRVDESELKKFVPKDLEIEQYQGSPWVSLVAFTMQYTRPRNLISFAPLSNFDEINIDYPRFGNLLSNSFNLCHYSPGVQVLAWSQTKNNPVIETTTKEIHEQRTFIRNDG